MKEIQQLTEEQAKELFKTNFWEKMNYEERTKFQTVQNRVCMPWDVYHEAISKYLDRPVYTHEFMKSNQEKLYNEVFNGAPAPTFEEIVNLIPEEKRIIITI